MVSTGLGPVYDGVAHFALSPEQYVPIVGAALLAGFARKGARATRHPRPASRLARRRRAWRPDWRARCRRPIVAAIPGGGRACGDRPAIADRRDWNADGRGRVPPRLSERGWRWSSRSRAARRDRLDGRHFRARHAHRRSRGREEQPVGWIRIAWRVAGSWIAAQRSASTGMGAALKRRGESEAGRLAWRLHLIGARDEQDE